MGPTRDRNRLELSATHRVQSFNHKASSLLLFRAINPAELIVHSDLISELMYMLQSQEARREYRDVEKWLTPFDYSISKAILLTDVKKELGNRC